MACHTVMYEDCRGDDAHPYDSAWNVMKDLRFQVQDLRAALLAEQQQRAAEVMSLRAEIEEVKQIQTKIHTDSKQSLTTLAADFVGHRSKIAKSLDEVKNSSKQAMAQLHSLLQNEVRDRRHETQMVHVKLSVLEEDFQGDHEIIQRELSGLNSNLGGGSATGDDIFGRVKILVHDIKTIEGNLFKIGTTFSKFNPSVFNFSTCIKAQST